MPPFLTRFKTKLFRLTPKREHADTPWTDSMTDNHGAPADGAGAGDNDANTSLPQPIIAAFSPDQQTATRSRHRGSIIIHQKSPLLLATPPQVTRTLAHSHPFILPLNQLAGLLSWTTGDPWESFLLVVGFWFLVCYGDDMVRWAGPLILVMGLMLAMYSRRYSPLSSTVWSRENRRRKRADSEGRKSLDEILETLRQFTDRCDVLLDPFLRMTESLSTQSSATSATTRPALTTLFMRICTLTPIWIVLAQPYIHIITTRHIVLAFGTMSLTWHSYPARVTRTILWRSRTIRKLCSLLTGLDLLTHTTPTTTPSQPAGQPNNTPKTASSSTTTASALKAKGTKPGVRFTFTLYENQRRWLGLGWTSSLLSYERQAWTDEHLHASPDPTTFRLPSTSESTTTAEARATTKWRWVSGSEWRVEGATTPAGMERSAKRIGGGGGGDESGWIYYDNKWQDGRKVDGWTRYTRRRKWVRDAELVEVDPNAPSGDEEEGEGKTITPDAANVVSGVETERTVVQEKDGTDVSSIDGAAATMSPARKKGAAGGWFAGGGGGSSGVKKPRRATNDRSDAVSKTGSVESTRSRDDKDDDVHTPIRYKQSDYWDRSIGDGIAESLG